MRVVILNGLSFIKNYSKELNAVENAFVLFKVLPLPLVLTGLNSDLSGDFRLRVALVNLPIRR